MITKVYSAFISHPVVIAAMTSRDVVNGIASFFGVVGLVSGIIKWNEAMEQQQQQQRMWGIIMAAGQIFGTPLLYALAWSAGWLPTGIAPGTSALP